MSFSYPVMLDVADRVIVVVGGGAVAVRKVRALLDAGATRVTVVSLEFHADLPDAARRLCEPYAAKHVDGADLVFAATDVRDVNDAVVRDCRARKIWVNRADNDDVLPGDFATPGRLRKGFVTVAVSAGSAALTAAIRDGIGKAWDDRWTAMAAAMQELRPMIVGARHLPPDRRTAMLQFLASEAALSLLEAEGPDALRSWVRTQLEA